MINDAVSKSKTAIDAQINENEVDQIADKVIGEAVSNLQASLDAQLNGMEESKSPGKVD